MRQNKYGREKRKRRAAKKREQQATANDIGHAANDSLSEYERYCMTNVIDYEERGVSNSPETEDEEGNADIEVEEDDDGTMALDDEINATVMKVEN